TKLRLASVKLSVRATNSKISAVGHLSLPLQNQKKASKLHVELSVPSSGLTAVYPIWVSPAHLAVDVPKNAHVVTEYNEELVALLEAGERVILFPNHATVENLSIKPQFISEF